MSRTEEDHDIDKKLDYIDIVQILFESKDVTMPFKSCLFMKEVVFSNPSHVYNRGAFPWAFGSDAIEFERYYENPPLIFDIKDKRNRPDFAASDLEFEELIFYNHHWWNEFQTKYKGSIEIERGTRNSNGELGVRIYQRLNLESLRSMVVGYLEHFSHSEDWECLLDHGYPSLFQSNEDAPYNRGSILFGWPMFINHSDHARLFINDRRAKNLWGEGQSKLPKVKVSLPEFIPGIKYSDIDWKSHPRIYYDGAVLDYCGEFGNNEIPDSYDEIFVEPGSSLLIQYNQEFNDGFISDEDSIKLDSTTDSKK